MSLQQHSTLAVSGVVGRGGLPAERIALADGQTLELGEDGVLLFDGGQKEADLHTPEGLELAASLLGPEVLMELLDAISVLDDADKNTLAQAVQTAHPEMAIFAQDASVAKSSSTQAVLAKGGMPTGAELAHSQEEVSIWSDADEHMIAQMFKVDPRHKTATPKLLAEMQKNADFQKAVQAGEIYLAQPTQTSRHEFAARMATVVLEGQDGRLPELLLLIFKEVLRENSKAAEYYLDQLASYNIVGDAIQVELKKLAEKATELNRRRVGQKEPEKVSIEGVPMVREFPMSLPLTKPYKPIYAGDDNGMFNRPNQIANRIKAINADKELLLGKKDMAQTAFNSWDQKTNRIYSMLIEVLKANKRLYEIGIRNIR